MKLDQGANYLEKKEASAKALPSWSVSASGKDSAPSENKLDWKAKKEEQARLRKKENDLKKCEEKIASLEERDSEINRLLSDPAIGTQVSRLQELSKEQAEIRTSLESLYEEWETLAQ